MVVTWLALTAGNFLYQAINNHDWLRACELSFFQGSAILTVYIQQRWFTW